MQESIRSYIHKEIDQQINTISGYMMYLEEIQLNFRGRNVLCVIGVGVVDNACCGIGGCTFIEVPGFVVSWKNSVDMSSRVMSEIESIKSEMDKSEIKLMLDRLYPHSQISFG